MCMNVLAELLPYVAFGMSFFALGFSLGIAYAFHCFDNAMKE